jgi:hypothetical protein
MAYSHNTDALLAGLAWLPWSEDPSGDCPSAIIQFFESLEIGISVALSKSSRQKELSEWLNSQFRHSHKEKVVWFDVGIHAMVASRMFARGAAPQAAEDALTAYRAVLQEAGVSFETTDRIASIVRELGFTPLDRQIFARLLEELEEQSRIPSTSAMPTPHSNLWAAASYYLTVALVVAIALVGFSKDAPPFVLPSILVGGLLLTTAIGGLGAFRD